MLCQFRLRRIERVFPAHLRDLRRSDSRAGVAQLGELARDLLDHRSQAGAFLPDCHQPGLDELRRFQRLRTQRANRFEPEQVREQRFDLAVFVRRQVSPSLRRKHRREERFGAA